MRISKIDFLSEDFKFITKSDEEEYYVPGTEVKIEGDYTEWKTSFLISKGWGFFRGLTMITYRGYDGELPRMDGDTARFAEFDIYYRGELLNEETTYEDLLNMIKSESRNEIIDKIIKPLE